MQAAPKQHLPSLCLPDALSLEGSRGEQQKRRAGAHKLFIFPITISYYLQQNLNRLKPNAFRRDL